MAAPTVEQAIQLALAHHQAGQLAEAEAIYRQILTVNPHHADSLHFLGIIAHQVGRNEVAVELILKAIALVPTSAVFHSNLGKTYRTLGRLDEAIAAYRRAIHLMPDFAAAHNNLGNALREQDHLHEAIVSCRRAIHLKPDYAEAHNNLANALSDQGQFDEAIAAYRKALQLKPDYADARYNYSESLLVSGDFEHGWPLYESRWELDDTKPSKRTFSQPLWRGEALEGRRVLLHAEQGLGDTLQFARYAPLVAQRGGRVIVECQPELKTLLQSVEGISQIIARGEPPPDFDLHCPMMSLSLAFGTRLETIPAEIPYLCADVHKAAKWRERLEQQTNPSQASALKVGLVWAGGVRPDQPNANRIDRRRSVSLSQLAPLAKVPGVVFVSLQKGGCASQAQSPPEGMTLLDWTDELKDFADTAALVEALDLVISVDTAVAHLAGAMGKPVWLLNRFDTCWRWMLGREDSPWYPTMRLFRQPKAGDWDSVIRRVVEELARFR